LAASGNFCQPEWWYRQIHRILLWPQQLLDLDCEAGHVLDDTAQPLIDYRAAILDFCFCVCFLRTVTNIQAQNKYQSIKTQTMEITFRFGAKYSHLRTR